LEYIIEDGEFDIFVAGIDAGPDDVAAAFRQHDQLAGQGGDAGGFDTDIKPAAVGEFVGDSEQVFGHGSTVTIGAEPLGQRAFFRNRLRNEDFGGASFDGNLKNQQADGAAAGDNHGIAGFDFGDINRVYGDG